MMMAASAVHMAVSELFAASGAHIRHDTGKYQSLASQCMVAIDRHAFVGNIGHGVDPAFARVFSTTVELHPHLDAGGKRSAWLDADQSGLVTAKRILGLELNAARITRLLALQGLFHTLEDAVVATVQVAHRLACLLHQFATDREQLVSQRDDA